MIKNKKDLKQYLVEDARRAGLTNKIIYLIKLLIGNEPAHALHYLKILRYYEYFHNQNSKFLSLWFRYRHSRLGLRYGIHIGINMVGYGFWIPHFSGGIIISCNSIGNYCSANSGVIVGNNGSQNNIATIGDNVILSMGCKVYGKIKIGDNVIIAPNSVVFKNVPSNVIISGIPAIIIKENNKNYNLYYHKSN